MMKTENKFEDEKGEFTDLGRKISDVLMDFEDPTSVEAINKAAEEPGVSAQDIRAFLDEWKDFITDCQQEEIEKISEKLAENLHLASRVPTIWQLSKAYDCMLDKIKKDKEEFKKRKQELVKKDLKKKMKAIEKTENREEMMASLQSMMDQLKNS
ncbi:MAG: hypothetical protein K2X08_06585 [Chlamydiales bacterium]|nr:hypothetical protein [Chlamydiales bacterium]